jgi:phage tail sheath gpL-like
MTQPVTSIPLAGLAASDPIPGVYVEVDLAQGPSSGATYVYAALLIANATSAGDATKDTVVYGPYGTSPAPFATEADVIARSGQGSEMHRMWRRFVSINSSTPVFGIHVTASAGTAASLSITFATTATASGTVRFYYGSEFIDTTVNSGDNVTTIATNVKNNINSQGNWPITATNASGVLTVTAKIAGPRGNWFRVAAVCLTPSFGTTSSVTAQTFLTSGATADSNVTALSTIDATRYYYLVSAAEDTTQLGALSAQVTTQAVATSGIRQTIIAASVDTESNAQTIAIALNQARAEYIWMQNSDWPPCELAAHCAALYALGEAPDGVGGPSLHNFNGLGGGPGSGGANPLRSTLDGLWSVPYPRGWTAQPTRTTILGAINNGLSPITANAQTGKTYLVMRATTRTLTSSLTDYRIRWPHKVRICDFYADNLQTKLALQFGGMDIINDLQPGQRLPNNMVTTPTAIGNAVNAQTQQWGDDGQFQNAAAIIAATQVVREISPKTRVGVRIPAETADTLDQLAIQILQVA